MESNNSTPKKFLLFMTIGITIPQVLLLAILLIKPLWVFLEDEKLIITVGIFLAYYIVFSIMCGIRTYKVKNNITTAIAQFIFSNFYQSIIFAVVMYLCGTFLLNYNFGLSIIFIGYILLTIISVLIFVVTCICAKNKKENKADF